MTEHSDFAKPKNNRELIKQQAVEYFQEGKGITEIAKLLDISRKSAILIIPRLEIVKRIEELLMRGKTIKEMGKTLGINDKTVRNYIDREKIVIPNENLALELFLEHLPIVRIAKIVNMNTQQVITNIPDSFRQAWLEELYIKQKLSYDEIITKIGISRTSLKNWLNKYDLKRRYRSAGKEMKKYPKKTIMSDYLKLNSIETIVEKRGYAKSTIRRILHQAGIQTDKALSNIRNHADNKFNVPINSYLMEVITGELLGDLSIEFQNYKNKSLSSVEEYFEAIMSLQKIRKRVPKNMNNAIKIFNRSLDTIHRFPMGRFRFCMSILTIPWANHIKQIFESNGIILSSLITNSKIVQYPSVNLTSKNSAQIAYLYKNWYPKGKKIVPRNIRITPTVLFHWFIGDGSYNDTEISFSTHSFSYNDVDYLVNLLSNEFGINSHWREEKSNSNNQPFLVIGRKKDRKTFFRYLECVNQKSLFIAKILFPWKFDGKLRKKEVMKSSNYQSVLKKLLENDEKEYLLIKRTSELP